MKIFLKNTSNFDQRPSVLINLKVVLKIYIDRFLVIFFQSEGLGMIV